MWTFIFISFFVFVILCILSELWDGLIKLFDWIDKKFK